MLFKIMQDHSGANLGKIVCAKPTAPDYGPSHMQQSRYLNAQWNGFGATEAKNYAVRDDILARSARTRLNQA
jgi:hypothetical protein